MVQVVFTHKPQGFCFLTAADGWVSSYWLPVTYDMYKGYDRNHISSLLLPLQSAS